MHTTCGTQVWRGEHEGPRFPLDREVRRNGEARHEASILGRDANCTSPVTLLGEAA